MKKVIVTGAGGFIGTHLCKELESRGLEVLKVDQWYGWKFPRRIKSVSAMYCLGWNWKDHQKSYEFTMKHFAKAKDNDIPLVFVSSAAVYGRATTVPIPATAVPAPVSSYGIAKDFCERHLDGYGCIARLFNVYGPGGHGLVSLLAEGKVSTIYNPSHIRDYVHVSDVARQLANCFSEITPKVFNVCTGVGTSNWGVVQQMRGISPKKTMSYNYTTKAGEIPVSIGENINNLDYTWLDTGMRMLLNEKR